MATKHIMIGTKIRDLAADIRKDAAEAFKDEQDNGGKLAYLEWIVTNAENIRQLAEAAALTINNDSARNGS